MADKIYTDGFPDGWSMVHRPDATLLVRKGDGWASFGSTCICAAPKLQQGEEWLETAKNLAIGFAGIQKQFLKFREAAYCDKCGYGPRVDDDGYELEHSRSVKTWECEDCGHINQRPVAVGKSS